MLPQRKRGALRDPPPPPPKKKKKKKKRLWNARRRLKVILTTNAKSIFNKALKRSQASGMNGHLFVFLFILLLIYYNSQGFPITVNINKIPIYQLSF